MTEFTISVAKVPIKISALYETSKKFCADYLSDEEPKFSVEITPLDIENEKALALKEEQIENLPHVEYSEGYLETLAIYRKISVGLLDYNVIIFHGASISMDGEGYLFTAKSGTGKTTHVNFWLQTFKDRAFIINGDKPLIKITDGGAFVCGTPWQGKEKYGRNVIVPLKAVCVLYRGDTDSIEKTKLSEELNVILQQIHRPSDSASTVKTLSLTDKLFKTVPLYKLNCTLNPDSAKVSYNGMQSGVQYSSIEKEIEKNGKIIYTSYGKSMLPLIRENKDILTVESVGNRKLKKYDIVLFKRENKCCVLHRIRKIKGDKYFILGDNCLSGDYVKKEDIIGILTEIKSDGKTVKTKKLPFKLKSRIICVYSNFCRLKSYIKNKRKK